MKKSFLLTSALVFIFSVSVFGFYKFIGVEKVNVNNLSATTITNTSGTGAIQSTLIYYPDGSTLQTSSSGEVGPTIILETDQMVLPSKGNSNEVPYFIGSAGTTPPPTNITTPSSIPFLDKIIPLNSFKNLKDNPLDRIFNQLFYLGLIIAVVLAVVMIIRGGIEYMTTDAISGKESGKKRVQAALGGLLLAFSAVLILNTINPGITNLKIVFPGLSEVKGVNVIAKNPPSIGNTLTPSQVTNWSKDEYGNSIKTQPDGTSLISTPDGKTYTKMKDGTVVEGFVTATGDPINAGTTPLPITGKSEEEVREYFKQNGIGINHDVPCNPPDIDGVVNGCTNVRGLGESAMRGLVNLKNASGASVEVTGGTEKGHKTHGIGKPIVDLSNNDSSLNTYITKNAVSVSQGTYTTYTHSDGTTYMNEGDHWHVVFK